MAKKDARQRVTHAGYTSPAELEGAKRRLRREMSTLGRISATANLPANLLNRMAGRDPFSFRRWIKSKAASQAGASGRHAEPLGVDARIRAYRAQNGAGNVLTPAQVRRIEAKAAKAGVLPDARLALAGRRVRVGGRTRVLYPELVA